MTMVSLENLWQRGCDFLGVSHAILGGAMTWVSNNELVAAISNAGAFGVLASGAAPCDVVHKEILLVKEKTQNPFGVNLILLNPLLDDLINVCIHNRVSHVVLAGGIPGKSVIDKLHDHNCKVMAFAPSLSIARKLVKMKIDALIIEGSEAGGHIGPVSTTVLAQEILPHIHEVPVFVAGGIGRGEAIASYLMMGASGCQLGTRFVCAHESPAHPAFKKAFIYAHSRDAMPSVQIDSRFPVIPVRALANQTTQKFHEAQLEAIRQYESGECSLKDAQLSIEHFWAGSLRRAVVDGDVENGSLMAGQSVGFVDREEPTQTIVDLLVHQAREFLEKKIKFQV